MLLLQHLSNILHVSQLTFDCLSISPERKRLSTTGLPPLNSCSDRSAPFHGDKGGLESTEGNVRNRVTPKGSAFLQMWVFSRQAWKLRRSSREWSSAMLADRFRLRLRLDVLDHPVPPECIVFADGVLLFWAPSAAFSWQTIRELLNFAVSPADGAALRHESVCRRIRRNRQGLLFFSLLPRNAWSQTESLNPSREPQDSRLFSAL